MNRLCSVILLSAFIILVVGLQSSQAHFGTIIPSKSMLPADGARKLQLTFSFIHPFEQHGMPLARPKAVGVVSGDVNRQLLSSLKPVTYLNHRAWQLNFRVKRPGSYIFYMEPIPYWEPAEDCYIIHYTKTVVAAFGDDSNWDEEIGLKTEIVPVSRPFALYTHNLFQGIVKLNGMPVPLAEIEVEYLNADQRSEAPDDLMITQTIKADINGMFSYSAPKSGWWGFAALTSADYKLPYKGTPRDVELGAVIWVQFQDWQEKN